MSFSNLAKTKSATPLSTTCVTCHYQASLASLALGSIAAIAGVAIAFSNHYLPKKIVARVEAPWMYRSAGIIVTTLGVTAMASGTYGLLHPKIAIRVHQEKGHVKIAYNADEGFYYLIHNHLKIRLQEDPKGQYIIDNRNYAAVPLEPSTEEL